MCGTVQPSKTVKIVYYSGTGSTAKAAECLKAAFEGIGWRTHMLQIKAGIKDQGNSHDLLVLLFAVHACNAPEAVYHWIDQTALCNGTPAAVLSISGGGEVSPNTACRVSSMRRLKKQGYDVTYDRMLVMPSNWIVATSEPLAVRLLEVLPERTRKIANDLAAGVRSQSKPLVLDRVFSVIGEAEKPGAKMAGKHFTATEACNGCGWCVNKCPSGNIQLVDHKPVFGMKCHLCLSCVYGCPHKAVQIGMGKFIAIKDGYSLKALEAQVPYPAEVNVEDLAKGFLWSGIKKYLLNPDA